MMAQLQVHMGWLVGGILLVVFFVVLRHERRQARKLVERSQELERLSFELLRVNKMKSEFLANVSHELRTPLNAIVGFVDLLRDGVYGELTLRQSTPVQRIEASANHLRHLVDQVLDLAKIAAGRVEIHTAAVDLRPFVMEIASEVEPLVTAKKLHLSLAVSASLPRVVTDPMHLRQILTNLLGNAVKYTETGGIIVRARLVDGDHLSIPSTLSGTPRTSPALFGTSRGRAGASSDGRPSHTRTSSHRGAWVVLQVVDTGIGIAAGDQFRIFEEFEQVNAGPRGDSMNRGTGLGLPISRRLAVLLGGDITVESEVSKGSTFTVWLPAKTT